MYNIVFSLKGLYSEYPSLAKVSLVWPGPISHRGIIDYSIGALCEKGQVFFAQGIHILHFYDYCHPHYVRDG